MSMEKIDLWLPDVAKNWVGDWVKPRMSGIELGCGCSTLWLAERVKHLVSIEGNETWYKRISELLVSRGVENVELIYAEPNKRYLAVLKGLEDGAFDFAFSDGPGALRSQCIIQAWPKVKVGGALIADDTQAPHSMMGRRFLEKQGVKRQTLRGPGTNPWNGRRNERGWETSVWIRRDD